MKDELVNNLRYWSLLVFLLLLTACTAQNSPKEKESMNATKSETVSDSSEQSRILGRGDGWLEDMDFYRSQEVFPLYVVGEQYRLDIKLDWADTVNPVDLSMFKSQQIYAMVSFDGIIPFRMQETKNTVFPISADNGSMPRTISFSVSSDRKAFDEDNEAILQEFIHGKRDRLNASVYLFAPDGYGIQVIAGILLPENILTGTNTVHAKTIANAVPGGDAPIHVCLLEENGERRFDVQFDYGDEIASDVQGDYYLQMNASGRFPYCATSGEQVQKVPLIKANTGTGGLKTDKEMHYSFPLDKVLTEEQRSRLEGFLAHPDRLGFPLFLSLHDQFGRIRNKATVYITPVQ